MHIERAISGAVGGGQVTDWLSATARPASGQSVDPLGIVGVTHRARHFQLGQAISPYLCSPGEVRGFSLVSEPMSDAPTRTQAIRLLAHELAVATRTITFSDDEKAPKYQLLPSGGRANRVYVVGTVTEIADVASGAREYLRARVIDPNGDTFFAYAGQYQPEALEALRDIETPAYVAVVGKPSTYETDDDIYVSIKPETVQMVNEATRNRWVVKAVEQTLDRIEAGLNGASPPGESNLDTDLFGMAAEEYGQEVIEVVREKATEAVATLQGEQAAASSDDQAGEPSQAPEDGETAVSDGGDSHICEVCGDSFDSQQGLSVHQGMMAKRDDKHGEQALSVHQG